MSIFKARPEVITENPRTTDFFKFLKNHLNRDLHFSRRAYNANVQPEKRRKGCSTNLMFPVNWLDL